ncbi:MAG: hypothetical protein QNK92_08310 [Amylibacter sp.]
MSVVAFSKTTDDGVNDITLNTGVLDTLLPLHMHVSADGLIVGAGRTLRKLLTQNPMMNCSVFEVLNVKRPAGINNVAAILAHQGESLSVQLNEMSGQNMKAVAAMMPDGGFILNLSLGAGVMDVVSARNLKNKDFSPADPIVEVIYMSLTRKWGFVLKKGCHLKMKGSQNSKRVAN